MRKSIIRIFPPLAVMLLAFLFVSPANAIKRGLPFIRNFTAAEYDAHNRNYDICCDANGTVYVANFEGLIYYDGCTWRKIHTPHISRVTRLANGGNGRIWVGGHKVFGYIEADEKGCLRLHTIVSDEKNSSLDEVDLIKVTGKEVYVHTVAGKIFYLKDDDKLVPMRNISSNNLYQFATDSIANLIINDLDIGVVPNGGISLRKGENRYTLTQADGLCSNNINFITFDKKSTLWGATEHGVFAIEIPSPYTHIGDAQGLLGDVYSLGQLGNTLFIGTLQGLYSFSKSELKKYDEVNMACWQLLPYQGDKLLAATTSGLWSVSLQGLRKITEQQTLSVLPDGKGNYIVGLLDGIYRVTEQGVYSILAKIEKVTSLSKVGNTLRAETIYGEVWSVDINAYDKKKCIRQSEDPNEPKIDYTDPMGRRWTTDFQGKFLKAKSARSGDKWMHCKMYPIWQRTLNAVLCTGDASLWVGGDFGLINCNLNSLLEAEKTRKEENIYIRQVITDGDSVLWGGYSQKGLVPVSQLDEVSLPSSSNMLNIYFSATHRSIFYPIQYSYRLNSGTWSKFSESTLAHFSNMPYGYSTIEIKGTDMYGNQLKPAKVRIYVPYPFYMRWWAILLYIIATILLLRVISDFREKRLRKDKLRLEKIVTERTSELSTALYDLQRTQADLVRMERTATAGKLTQGLIDRILNPINYINNFAKLTCGLAKDLRDDIEDEQDNMSKENYEDCDDIINMMTQNLEKIEHHGVSTTRTLRAMEAMLKHQIGAKHKADISGLCNQAVKVANQHFNEEITQCNVTLRAEVPDEPIIRKVDKESFYGMLVAMINNSIYAVVKKYQREKYAAEVVVKLVETSDQHLQITIYDNGIGIEDAIQEKVFDPFFTTKPTAEAAGVGLYLSREVVQDHGGTISLRSEKDKFTEFTIII